MFNSLKISSSLKKNRFFIGDVNKNIKTKFFLTKNWIYLHLVQVKNQIHLVNQTALITSFQSAANRHFNTKDEKEFSNSSVGTKHNGW